MDGVFWRGRAAGCAAASAALASPWAPGAAGAEPFCLRPVVGMWFDGYNLPAGCSGQNRENGENEFSLAL